MPELTRHPERKYINSGYNISVVYKYIYTDVTPLHWHEFYEIEFFLSGTGVSVMNGKKYEICPGTLFFMTPVDIHSYNLEGTAEVVNISFTANAIEDMGIAERLAVNNGAAIFLSKEQTDWLIQLANKIKNEVRSGNYMDKKYISQMLGCILIELLRKTGRNGNEAESPDSIQQAVQYIYLHFREDLTLENTAARAGISPNHFSEKFHSCMNLTFKEYLTRIRLDYAVKLLLYTDISIAEVSYFSGFNSTSYFLRTFKKRFLMSPLVYRKNNRFGELEENK